MSVAASWPTEPEPLSAPVASAFTNSIHEFGEQAALGATHDIGRIVIQPALIAARSYCARSATIRPRCKIHRPVAAARFVLKNGLIFRTKLIGLEHQFRTEL